MAKATIFDQRYRNLVLQLIDARKAKAISQEWIADQMGWSQQIVSRYETFERRLDTVEFADLARLLGLDAAAMVEAIPQPRR